MSNTTQDYRLFKFNFFNNFTHEMILNHLKELVKAIGNEFKFAVKIFSYAEKCKQLMKSIMEVMSYISFFCK